MVFEDKGNRFVARDLVEQDQHILDKLEDVSKFDEELAGPRERVEEKMGQFCERWVGQA